MYEAFFNLKENPFGTTPDPRFLYKSKAHRDALAYLAYGVFRKKGFLVVSGGVGIGKTTIIRAFIQTFHPCLEVAFLMSTKVDFRELLYMLLVDFGVEIKNDSKVAMLSALNEYLIQRFAENQNPLLIIDEAQNLTPDVLEELRMLSNLETDETKLIQIVLVGQQELTQMLMRDDLRQLRQRIPGVFHMQVLTREEVFSYILYRLGVAGLRNGQLMFSDAAVDVIHQFSEGVPRLVNMLCDHVLLRGYLQKTRVVKRELVEASIQELSYLAKGAGGGRSTSP